ncbi:MAG: hypothetical protein QME50_05025 [Candidatus Bathyarchaeota archaeon]|nr:hypothetical protein [Candidatus Bathyarchaeota archaeon]
MGGRFENAVIVFMSCNGLNPNYIKTAEAFINKGVKVFISWDGWIEKADNDNAIALLLKYLIKDNCTVSEAISGIHKYSTSYGISKLDYYPHNSEVENYRIPNYKQSNVSSIMVFWLRANLRKLKTKS